MAQPRDNQPTQSKHGRVKSKRGRIGDVSKKKELEIKGDEGQRGGGGGACKGTRDIQDEKRKTRVTREKKQESKVRRRSGGRAIGRFNMAIGTAIGQFISIAIGMAIEK